MKPISLKQLQEWVEKNKDRTWHHTSFGKKSPTLEIKYLTFSLDTRDMKVWRVGYRGLGKEEVVIRDDNEKDGLTILDGLEKTLSVRSGNPEGDR